GHELALALGLNLCIARFGSVVNSIITPWIEQLWGVPTAIWVGTLSCVASFLSAVALVWMINNPPPFTPTTPQKEEQDVAPLLLDAPNPNTNNNANSGLCLTVIDHTGTPHAHAPLPIICPPTEFAIVQHLPGALMQEDSLVGSVDNTLFTPDTAESSTRASLHITNADYLQKQELWWMQWWEGLKFFPSSFWLLCAMTVLLYSTVVPFNNVASDFLQSKWYPNNPRKATTIMSIPDTIGAFLGPCLGIIVDRYGRRASILIASTIVLVIVHTTLGFTMINPIFAFSLLGIAYAMYGVAIWPSFACVITSELHLVGLVGTVVGFILKGIDCRDGGALEAPEIHVEAPVIMSQPLAGSVPPSAIASPAMSLARYQLSEDQRRLRLIMLRSSISESGLGWMPKRLEDYSDDDGVDDGNDSNTNKYSQQNAFLIQWEAQGENSSAKPSSVYSPDSPAPSSLMLKKMRRRYRRCHDRTLLYQALGKIRSPLLRQHSSSSRYGSIPSPSTATMQDEQWNIDEEAKTLLDPECYSVSEYPILYNPLRGSSGSFRISRNVQPVTLDEARGEGRIPQDD
ncbi:hypothetical protein BX616_006087, partial [Lobosporangium transversale]